VEGPHEPVTLERRPVADSLDEARKRSGRLVTQHDVLEYGARLQQRAPLILSSWLPVRSKPTPAGLGGGQLIAGNTIDHGRGVQQVEQQRLVALAHHHVPNYGAPIGWRLALANPQAITAIITQNGNGYDAGFVDRFWTTVWDYQREQTPQTEANIRAALTLDATKWQYVTGVPDESLVSPDTWHHDFALLSRPGNDAIQLKLFRNYEAYSRP
jgi:hypothetical protein